MGRSAVSYIVTAKFLVGAVFVVTPADAQISRERMVCTGQVLAAQPDQRVAACTAAIEASGETPTNLAVAYCARGVAYHARDQLDRAIADYNEFIKIAARSATSSQCRGFANLARGAIGDAITDFSEAIARDARSASSFLSRGRGHPVWVPGQPWRLHPSRSRFVASPRIGYASRPNSGNWTRQKSLTNLTGSPHR
jgi:tetratricopeptide (TPR) repeat protein